VLMRCYASFVQLNQGYSATHCTAPEDHLRHSAGLSSAMVAHPRTRSLHLLATRLSGEESSGCHEYSGCSFVFLDPGTVKSVK